MPRILALQGKGNSGKTTTINLLPNILIANGYREITELREPHGRDFLKVFKKGRKKVGVTSLGDSFEVVFRSLNKFLSERCDVSVCACRTYDRPRNGRPAHGTIAAVNSFPTYTVHFIEKTRSISISHQIRDNRRDAERLFINL
jgi:hypothetical protein